MSICRPGVILSEEKPEFFKVYWEPPDGIVIDDPIMNEPEYEKTLLEVGVENIVDCVKINISGEQIDVNFNERILEQLVPEQRQVVIAHLTHILYKYMNQPVDQIFDYITKYEFHKDIQVLANMEDAPGEF